MNEWSRFWVPGTILVSGGPRSLRQVGSLLHGTYILSDHTSEQEKEEAIWTGAWRGGHQTALGNLCQLELPNLLTSVKCLLSQPISSSVCTTPGICRFPWAAELTQDNTTKRAGDRSPGESSPLLSCAPTVTNQSGLQLFVSAMSLPTESSCRNEGHHPFYWNLEHITMDRLGRDTSGGLGWGEVSMQRSTPFPSNLLWGWVQKSRSWGTPSAGSWDTPSFSVCIRGPLRCSRSNKLEEFLCPSRESEIAGRPSPLKSELFIAVIWDVVGEGIHLPNSPMGKRGSAFPKVIESLPWGLLAQCSSLCCNVEHGHLFLFYWSH